MKTLTPVKIIEVVTITGPGGLFLQFRIDGEPYRKVGPFDDEDERALFVKMIVEEMQNHGAELLPEKTN